MPPTDPPRRLGRGLDALLSRREPAPTAKSESAEARSDQRSANSAPDASKPSPGESSALRTIPLDRIRPNPYQPRREFRAEELAELEASLRVSGLLQPITVRPAPTGDGYELIAGERRFRAAGRLGWNEIPAIVRETDDRDALTLAMIENLQRSDLDPIEEAEGYQRLIEEFKLSQSEVAELVGKERSTVANAVRLRSLPSVVRSYVQQRKLSAGHARAMLPLVDSDAIISLANDAIEQSLSVRDVERRVQTGRGAPATTGRKPQIGSTPAPNHSSAESRRIEELLRRKLQTGVNINLSAPAKGEVRIAFYSNDDLERLLTLFNVSVDDDT